MPSCIVSPRRATVITDASFCWDTKAGGWAAWVKADGEAKPLCRSGPLKGQTLNSTFAEVKAALNGVWLARNQLQVTHILLQSDCSTVIDLVGGRVKAPDLITLWDEAFARDDMQDVYLTARHVKGHGIIKDARTFVNDWCDKYAKLHMRKERDNARARRR